MVLTELQCALTIHRTLSCIGVDNNIVRIMVIVIDIVFGVIESLDFTFSFSAYNSKQKMFVVKTAQNDALGHM